jgi:hypothetical protein
MASSRDIIADAARVLNDPRNEQWTTRELLDWLNEGLQALVTVLPKQFVSNTVLTLVAGAKQALPTGAAMLERCIRTIDANTGAPISAVQQVNTQSLDSYSPGWHAAATAAVEEWAYDPAVNPYVFWVNPPAAAGSKLEVDIVSNPPTLQIDGTIPIEARYNAKLVDYIVYRALSKDADYAAQDGRATIHRNRFYEGSNNGAAQNAGQ